MTCAGRALASAALATAAAAVGALGEAVVADTGAPQVDFEWKMLTIQKKGDPDYADDVTLQTAIYGKDTATNRFLCIHGFPDQPFSWMYFLLPYLHLEFGDDIQVVAPAMRGVNRSEPKLHNESFYMIQRLASDIHDLWDQHFAKEGTQGFWLLAHDWGAAVSWIYVGVMMNKELRGFIPMAIPFPATGCLMEVDQAAAGSYRALYMQAPFTYYALEAGDFRNWGGMFSAIANQKLDPVRHFYREGWGYADALLYHFLWYTANIRIKGSPTALPPPTVPTMLIWGLRETANSAVELCCQTMFVNDLAVAKVNASHWIYHEKPDLVASLVKQYVDHWSQPGAMPFSMSNPDAQILPLQGYCASHPDEWTLEQQGECTKLKMGEPPYDLDMTSNESAFDRQMAHLREQAEVCEAAGCPGIVRHAHCLVSNISADCVSAFCTDMPSLHACSTDPNKAEACGAVAKATLLDMAWMIFCNLPTSTLQDVQWKADAFKQGGIPQLKNRHRLWYFPALGAGIVGMGAIAGLSVLFVNRRRVRRRERSFMNAGENNDDSDDE